MTTAFHNRVLSILTANAYEAADAILMAQEIEAVARSLLPCLVPAGWRLVPEVETREMLTAMFDAMVPYCTQATIARAIVGHRAMLSAAPQPPVQTPPPIVDGAVIKRIEAEIDRVFSRPGNNPYAHVTVGDLRTILSAITPSSQKEG